jgi:hypothetical protein
MGLLSLFGVFARKGAGVLKPCKSVRQSMFSVLLSGQ